MPKAKKLKVGDSIEYEHGGFNFGWFKKIAK